MSVREMTPTTGPFLGALILYSAVVVLILVPWAAVCRNYTGWGGLLLLSWGDRRG